MTKNMGSLDRTIRPIIAAVLIALFFTKVVTGTLGIILLIVAGIFLLTSLAGNCLIYSLFGINTCKVKEG